MAAPKHPKSPKLAGPIFFGTLFAGSGGVLLFQLLQDSRARSNTQTFAIGIGMAAIFLLVGLATIGGSLRKWNKARNRAALGGFQNHRPWTERADWARGEIESDAATGIVFWWCFGGVWNAVAWPVFFLALPEIRHGNHAAWAAALFPLVGIGLLVAAVRTTLRRLKYGRCRLVLAQTPVPIGGRLTGRIIVPSRLVPESDPIVSLDCVKRVTTGSGKNRRTETRGLWRHEVEIDRTRLAGGPMGTEIAVSIPIAESCRATDDDERISWELSVRAATSGLDFETRFVVPVFEDPEGAARSRRDDRTHAAPSMERRLPTAERLQNAKIRWIDAGPAGHPELIFPPTASAPGNLIGLAMGAGMLYGSYLCFHHHVSTFGAIVLGAMGGLILFGTLGTFRGPTRVRLEPAALLVSSRGLFGLKTKRVDPTLIRAVKAGLGGARQGQSGTYQIMLDCDAAGSGGGLANALYGSLLTAAAERAGKPLDRRPGLPVPLGGVFASQSAANDVAAFLEEKLRARYRLAGQDG